MQTENDALADRLEEAALASLPFGSGELAQALAEANAVRRGESAMLAGSGPAGRNPPTARDARIARAAERLLAAFPAPAVASPAFQAAWDRLVQTAGGGAGEAQESSDTWQPMASVPKDGTRILVDFGSAGIHAVAWEEAVNGPPDIWCVDDRKHGPFALRGYQACDCRGWMPLPAPAEGGAE